MMHATAGRRGGFQPRAEANHFVMSDFALGNDHGKSRIYPAGFPASPGPVLQHGGGTRNTTTVFGDSSPADVVSYGKGGFCAQQTQKNHVAATMSAGAGTSAGAGLFSAEGYAGIGSVSDILRSPQAGDAARPQGELKNKGNDLSLSDWPELGPLEGFETGLRKLDSPFEILGANYFNDPMWPSICSLDAQLVPSSHFDSDPNSSALANKPILQSTASDAHDSTDQIYSPNPTSMQQLSKNKGRETPLMNCSSPEEIEHFPPLSEADLFFCPFDDMLVPTSSNTMYCNDEIMSSSSTDTLSGPDTIPRCSPKKKKPHATTPDMILDEMAGNPLEMYFPPLSTYEHPEAPMRGAAASTQNHHQQLLPEAYFAAAGSGAALDSSGLEFGQNGRRAPGGGLPESPRSMKAAQAKHAGFQKLQEGMNQLDVGAKTCIRDALYRLANSVERRHCVDQTAGSSGSGNRLKATSVWTETQGSPMDRSVAQLLLQKPLQRKTIDRLANSVA